MTRWLAALSIAAAMGPCGLAAAQSVTLVAVSSDASPELRDALRIELQLAGVPARVVAFEGGPAELRALSSHASANVVGVLRRGGRTLIVSVLGGRWGEESVARGVDRRAVAMLVSSLVVEAESTDSESTDSESTDAPSVEPRVVAPASPAPPVVPPPSTERSRLAVPRGELVVPPALQPPSRLAPPLPEPEAPPASEPEAPLAPVLERVGFETLGAVLGGGVLALGGALLADALAMGDPFPWWAVGLTVAATLGSTAGVLLAGRLTGADGDAFWTSVAGVGAGAAAGLLLLVGYATDTRPDDGVTSGWTYFGAVLAAVLPSALSILTFELTVPERQTPRLSLRVGPLGIDGRF